MLKPIHDRSGVILVASIMLIVFASIAVLRVTTFIIQRFSQNRSDAISTQSLYLAQAGINQAIYSYRTNGVNPYFTPGTITIPGDTTSQYIIGGTASSGLDADFLMVDTNAASWASNTYDTIAIRSEGSGSGTTNSSTGIFTVNRPASFLSNDYIVCIIGKKATNVGATVAPPAGWTTGDQLGTTTGNDVYGGIFYKKAASESATYTFDSNGVSETFGYWIGSLSGIDQTTPEDVSFSTGTGQWVNSQNDTTPNLPSVTTVTPGAFALGAWSLNADSATTQPASPWLNRANDVGSLLNVMSKILATAGTATGTGNLSAVAANQETQRGTFVFRPSASERRLDYGRIKSVISSSVRTLTITDMAVTWTTPSRNLMEIGINGIRWSGIGASGEKKTLSPIVSGINPTGVTTNYLLFDGDMQKATLTLTATYYLSDNSTQTVTLWPISDNNRFTVRASGKKTGSNIYRTIEAEYNANTSTIVGYTEINALAQ